MTSDQRLVATLSVIAAVVSAFIIGYAAGLPEKPVYTVTVEEDGAGVQTINGEIVQIFPEDTFVWDCNVMGNLSC